MTEGEYLDADLLVYVMFREESRLAEFITNLAAIGRGIITSVITQRGFQRADGRELGGFRDGLRSTATSQSQGPAGSSTIAHRSSGEVSPSRN